MGDVLVTLTATIENGTASDTKVFNLNVKRKDFSLAEITSNPKTFRISGDGYPGNQFTVGNFDMDTSSAIKEASITVNGITYTVNYTQHNAIATVSASGTATADAVATTRLISVEKDTRIATITLNIPAVTAGDSASNVDFTITN